jgi:hypothetical protein
MGPKVVIALRPERLLGAIGQVEHHAVTRLDSADAYERTLEVRHEGRLQPGESVSRRCQA